VRGRKTRKGKTRKGSGVDSEDKKGVGSRFQITTIAERTDAVDRAGSQVRWRLKSTEPARQLILVFGGVDAEMNDERANTTVPALPGGDDARGAEDHHAGLVVGQLSIGGGPWPVAIGSAGRGTAGRTG
jgi:hypothetical protein